MQDKVVLLDDDAYDLTDTGQPEYDFSVTRRDKERERRFRAQALERLPGDEARLERLKVNAGEAARLLRLALADAEADARVLPLALRAVIAARGSLDGLDLSRDEMLAMVHALAGYISERLPQAA